MNNGIVNWPEIKTRRIRPSVPAGQTELDPKQRREKGVLTVVANNLEQLKVQVVQTIQRL